MENKTFEVELKELCEKYKVTKTIYGGEKDGKFFAGSISSKAEALEIAIIAARLYRYTRESCRSVMEDFERGIK